MRKALIYIFICLIGLASLAVMQPALAKAEPPPAVSTLATTATSTGKVSISQQLATKAKSSWPWYVSRAAGMVAVGLLVLLILSGIGQITGITYRLLEPLAAWSLHRALGIALGATILVHVFSLLFDKYVHFGIGQLLVPFMSHYTPVTLWGVHLGSLYISLGIFAFYIAALIIITSLFIMDRKPILWRTIHYSSYLLVALVFLHGLFLGTDIKGVFRVIWWFSAGMIIIGIISRLRRARTLKHK